VRWAGEDIAGRKGFDKAWLFMISEMQQGKYCGPKDKRGLLNELRNASGEDIAGRKGLDNAWFVYDLRDAAGEILRAEKKV
jgi:hypothetical protein